MAMTIRHAMCAFACLLAFASGALAQQAAAGDKPALSQEELEKQFAETMTDATLIGTFTINGLNDGKPLAEDRYSLGTVKKLPNGFWSFEARIEYGGHDVKLPLALPVKWAGDTPVITVTDVAFPGLGTYSARVLIYKGEYAGTWGGATHGGAMYGKIVKGDDAKAAQSKPLEKKKLDEAKKK